MSLMACFLSGEFGLLKYPTSPYSMKFTKCILTESFIKRYINLPYEKRERSQNISSFV
jgi:hypothetical protein